MRIQILIPGFKGLKRETNRQHAENCYLLSLVNQSAGFIYNVAFRKYRWGMMGDMGQYPTGNVSEEPRPQGAFPWLWRWGSPLPKMSRFQSPDSLMMGQEVVISLCPTYEP